MAGAGDAELLHTRMVLAVEQQHSCKPFDHLAIFVPADIVVVPLPALAVDHHSIPVESEYPSLTAADAAEMIVDGLPVEIDETEIDVSELPVGFAAERVVNEAPAAVDVLAHI